MQGHSVARSSRAVPANGDVAQLVEHMRKRVSCILWAIGALLEARRPCKAKVVRSKLTWSTKDGYSKFYF